MGLQAPSRRSGRTRWPLTGSPEPGSPVAPSAPLTSRKAGDVLRHVGFDARARCNTPLARGSWSRRHIATIRVAAAMGGPATCIVSGIAASTIVMGLAGVVTDVSSIVSRDDTVSAPSNALAVEDLDRVAILRVVGVDVVEGA